MAGRIIARELTLGEYVDTTHTAFTVADLSVVWVETAIAPGDLPFVKEGQMANIVGSGGKAEGKLILSALRLILKPARLRPLSSSTMQMAHGDQASSLMLQLLPQRRMQIFCSPKKLSKVLKGRM
ncbi:MAG: efflux RND transporter periplasmic adaptor subunit [Micavibrio sp.]|nr:efflux RND transporter periplasmic adaptor subunit [Micavibrio sp.]